MKEGEGMVGSRKDEIVKLLKDSIGYDPEQELIVGFEDAAELIDQMPHPSEDVGKVLGDFLMKDGVDAKGKPILFVDSESLATLQSALGKLGVLVFEKEAFVKKLASMRLVPGNEARALVEKLSKE